MFGVVLFFYDNKYTHTHTHVHLHNNKNIFDLESLKIADIFKFKSFHPSYFILFYVLLYLCVCIGVVVTGRLKLLALQLILSVFMII